MNRTIKDATVRRWHYDDHAQIERHLTDFGAACNFGCRLKTLKVLTPCEFIRQAMARRTARFKFNPLQQMPGPNIEFRRVS